MTKRRLFALITLSVPLLFLLLLELSLRTFEYGGDLRLVIDREIMGHRFLSINRQVGRRYFAGNTGTIPEPPDEFFLPVKPAGGIRIFCVGESTMAGFPYEYTATAPSMLKAALERRFPERHIEVINVGMAAIGSAVVRDMMRDLAGYDPDLFILYVGHNEFYGIFGAASSQGAMIAPWLTDLYLATLRFRTVLLMRDAIAAIGDRARSGQSLMEGLSQRASVHEQDPLYTRCLEAYGRNLKGMIDIAEDAGVPILISMPVSNLSGVPPFVPLPSSHTDQDAIDPIMTRAKGLLGSGALNEAIITYQQAVSLDSGRADIWYGLGKALQEADRTREARHAYTMARDLDGLRFRMATDFGGELLRVANDHGVAVARIDSAFLAESPDGIPGNHLFLEHVHPRINGYALIAKSWENTMFRYHLLPPGIGPAILTDELPSLSAVTKFDEAMGRIRISYLRHQWPFTEESNGYQFRPDGWVENLAFRFVNKEIPWQAARYQMADRYLESGEFGLARNEALAVSRILYFSYEPLLRIADYFLMEGDTDGALIAYRRSATAEENPFAHYQTGRILLEQNDLSAAVMELEKSLQAHRETGYKLPDRALGTTHYMLGYALVRLDRVEDGRRSLRRALQADPALAEARRMLESLGE